MFVDRKLQKQILEESKEMYPNKCLPVTHRDLWNSYAFNFNAFYLAEHGLIYSHYQEHRSHSAGGVIEWIRISAKGIDFLEEDGGLSAILNKVLIKFDEEDLTKLLAARLNDSNLPQEQKNSVMATIKTLPAEGIKTVYTHLLKLGLKHVPDIPQLIQNILDNL